MMCRRCGATIAPDEQPRMHEVADGAFVICERQHVVHASLSGCEQAVKREQRPQAWRNQTAG